MASSSASGRKLAELEEKLQGLEEQKAAVLVLSEIGPRDLILLGELNKDLDRVQAAITALSSGELYFSVSTSATHSADSRLRSGDSALNSLQVLHIPLLSNFVCTRDCVLNSYKPKLHNSSSKALTSALQPHNFSEQTSVSASGLI